jgi:hypothetical protein
MPSAVESRTEEIIRKFRALSFAQQLRIGEALGFYKSEVVSELINLESVDEEMRELARGRIFSQAAKQNRFFDLERAIYQATGEEPPPPLAPSEVANRKTRRAVKAAGRKRR